MSYAFSLYIDQKDVDQLVANGFYFAAVKTTGGTNPPVQWFAVLIEGNEIDVSWNVEYEVFFTTTALVAGATIKQGNKTSASTGQSYGYSQAAWAPSSSPVVNSSQIGVYNNYPNSDIRNFGINQVVTIGGKSRKTPIAAAPVGYYQGSAIFQPREEVNIYFALKTWSDDGTLGGVVVSSVTLGYKFTLLSGQPQYVRYSAGKWIPLPGPPDGGAISRSLAAPPSWYEKFAFFLAAPVDAYAFARWLEITLKNVVTRASGPAVQSAFVVEVLSDKNRTEEILALKGKYYETPLVTSLLEDGAEEITGRRVKILDVAPFLTPFDRLLKLLPAASGSAVHSH